MNYSLPSLPYNYGALEPYIDAVTMEIHHTRHHQGYVNNLNAALERHPELHSTTLDQLLTSLATLPEDVALAIRNNGGGHKNHSLFWTMMKPQGGGLPQGRLAEEIKRCFGSFDAFQAQFNTCAKSVFGSGWAWLSVAPNGQLIVSATPNQDTPLSQGLQPIMGLDVWEHAYYLQYQNKRPDYIAAWWHVIDWETVHNMHENLGL